MTPIIAKIHKLLSLAKSDNPNEAGAAAAQAARLMDEHRISVEELSQDDNPMLKDAHIHGTTKGNQKAWKCKLAVMLGKHNGCDVLMLGGALMATGRQSDVDITKYLFDFCVREIESLVKVYCTGHGRSYANDFKLGCVETIADKLELDRQELESSELAIVIVDRRYNEALALRENVGTRKIVSRSNSRAYYEGMEAAESIELRKGISGSTTPKLALTSGG